MEDKIKSFEEKMHIYSLLAQNKFSESTYDYIESPQKKKNSNIEGKEVTLRSSPNNMSSRTNGYLTPLNY